jgi:hypothetical protein
MSYVKASTDNPLGFRPWGSRLNFYSQAHYPLPTTGLSRPIHPSLNGLGTVNFSTRASFQGSRDWVAREGYYAPVPRVYGPPELAPSRTGQPGRMRNWVFTPQGPPPRAHGSPVDMFRIDPQTGKQIVTQTDILPRGLWQQNSFQPPAPAAVSPMGQSMIAMGTQRVQTANGQNVDVPTSPVLYDPRKRYLSDGTAPAPSDIGSQITAWFAGSMIPGVPNLVIAAVGAAALLLGGTRR